MTTRKNYPWSDEQIQGARQIMSIEANAPKCPECGVPVDCSKCLYEYDDVDCPRHDLEDEMIDKIIAVEIKHNLRSADVPYWRCEMPLFLRIGPPTEEEWNLLAWLDSNDGKFVVPRPTTLFGNMTSKGMVWTSVQYNDWTYSLNGEYFDDALAFRMAQRNKT